MSSFRALSEVIGERGLFCSLYADRASHYWHTPEAGGKVDKDNPDPGGARASAPRHRADPGLFARSQGAVRAHVRHLAEAPAPGTQARRASPGSMRPTASSRRSICPNTTPRFALPAEVEGSAFVSFAGALDDILCIQEERTVSNDNTVRYKRRVLQLPADRHRRHYVKATVRVHEYPDGTLAVFHGPRCLARYQTPTASPSTPQPGRPRDPLRRDRPKPCGQVDSRSAPDHFPTGPTTTTEAVNSYGT